MALGMHDTGSTRAGPLGPDLDRDGVAKAYGRWAPVYDLVFGPVFAQGRTLAAAAAERIGGRILEVGVGTGLSLPAYRRARMAHGGLWSRHLGPSSGSIFVQEALALLRQGLRLFRGTGPTAQPAVYIVVRPLTLDMPHPEEVYACARSCAARSSVG